jgi:hypothetical protein
MEASLFALIARLTGFAAAAAPMPATTFFAVQLVLAVLVRFDRLDLPPEAAWTVSFVAVGIGLVGAVFEWIAKLTDDVEEVLRDLHLDKLLGAVSTFAVSAMLVLAASAGHQAAEALETSAELQGVPPAVVEQITAMGLDWAERALPEAPAESGDAREAQQRTEAEQDLAGAVALIEASTRPGWQKLLVLLVAVALNMGLTTLRAELWERLEPVLEGLSLERMARFLESGGALLALLLVALAPIVLLVLLVLFTLALGVLLLALRGLDKVRDEARRRPCPHCGHRRRVEASLCPACHQALEPERWLVSAHRRRARAAAAGDEVSAPG